MGFGWDIIKEVFPSLKDSVASGWRAFNRSKRKRQEIFVLKAMTTKRGNDMPWPPPIESQYYLHFIERQIFAAVIEEATETRFGNTRIASATGKEIMRLREAEKIEKIKKVTRKYGLPLIDDPKRTEKIEAILHNMVDAKRLNFHPPDRFSIV